MKRLRIWRPDILALPEYYFVGDEFTDVIQSLTIRDKAVRRLKDWSLALGCIVIGGTVVEAVNDVLYNRCFLIDNGEIIGHYDKIHLFKAEGGGLISPGTEYRAFNLRGLKIGLLICADVLYQESFKAMRRFDPDFIFIPTTSPYKPGETAEVKFSRDQEIFVRGAEIADSIIFKVSASGDIVGHRLQGRSLIASPENILWRIYPENEDKAALILATISGAKQNPSLDIEVCR